MSQLTAIQILWIVSWIAVLGVCGFALVCGGRPERLSAGIILVSAVIYQFNIYVPADVRPSTAILLDGVSALGLVFVTVRYASLWLGGVMVLQAAQFTLHATYILAERPLDRQYSEINNTFVFIQMSILLTGVLVSQHRRRRAAKAPQLPLSQPPTP
jgi:hypothetical protein